MSFKIGLYFMGNIWFPSNKLCQQNCLMCVQNSGCLGILCYPFPRQQTYSNTKRLSGFCFLAYGCVLLYIIWILSFPKEKMSHQNVVILNVGGLKYTTWPSTLQQFPESRLAKMLNCSDREFRVVNGEFFVDRDGVLFSYILDFLRTLQVSLPSDFTDYQRLQREANFYELYSMADLLSQENLLKPKVEILEIRFLLQETQALFRVFGSCSTTIDALAGCVTIFAEQLGGPTWNNHRIPSMKPLVPLPLERPSHHDFIFQCGTDYSDQLGARFVSIKPDQRKLINGANVLGLLVDVLLKEGFHLVSTRTVSAEEKIECYCFERTRQPDAVPIRKAEQGDAVTRTKTATENRRN